MVDPEGAWTEAAVRDDSAASSAPGPDLLGELGLLEARVTDAVDSVLNLREERDGLAREREALLRECGELRRECESLRRESESMRREREETAARLAQIIARVDALRGEP